MTNLLELVGSARVVEVGMGEHHVQGLTRVRPQSTKRREDIMNSIKAELKWNLSLHLNAKKIQNEKQFNLEKDIWRSGLTSDEN